MLKCARGRRTEGDEESGYEPAAGRIRLVLIDEAGTVPEYKIPLLAALGAQSDLTHLPFLLTSC